MTSAIDIERRLRERYRQPAGVEQFGIEPVPEERKTAGWFDLFSIMFNFLINPGLMLSGGLMVAAGLSFQAAVAAGFFGTLTALAFYPIMATLGVDYGIPGQVATRVVYGLRGAKLIPSLLRTVVSIYWFSFQTLVGASAIVAVLAKMTGVTYSLVWVSMIFGFIQACVAVIGFGSLKVLARVALPIKVVVLAYLFVLFARHDDPNFELAKVLSYPGASGWTWVLLAGWLNVTIAGWLTNISDAADFARYTRARAEMWIGTLAAGALGALLSTALGAVRGGRNPRQGHQSFRADRPNRNQLGRFPARAGIPLRRRLDHQRAQSVFGRTVAFQHVRAAGAVLDHADRQRVRSRAVWCAGRVEFFSIHHLVRERVCAGRGRACVRLPVRATHADRRPRALRPERPLPLLGWFQSDRSSLDGDRLPDLHLRRPDRMDSSLADAADHGCGLPADRSGHAARQHARPGFAVIKAKGMNPG
jgi:hypothetical protein